MTNCVVSGKRTYDKPCSQRVKENPLFFPKNTPKRVLEDLSQRHVIVLSIRSQDVHTNKSGYPRVGKDSCAKLYRNYMETMSELEK